MRSTPGTWSSSTRRSGASSASPPHWCAASRRVVADLARWRVGASETDREALAAGLDEVDAALVEHLAAEEEQLLPIAARHLTPAEWGQLGEEGMGGLKKRQLPLVFGMLQYQGDPEVIAMMLSHAPAPARLLMPFLAPRAFRRYATRVHGTATP